ncbi:MAG: cation transporter [Firmicutes bacterium]|nr:cation transporter [Candidatus Caballimonas caccae]
MKTVKNILIAFILNLSFAIFEFVGGFFTGSVAIFSDAIHDLGDAISIGVSLFLEKKSKKQPDKNYSYGYQRYSCLGSLFTTLVLLIGSCFVIYGAVNRIINPTVIQYDKMIMFAIFGVVVNALATFFTHKGDSVNQKAVNLHMLEDVLGWIIVLIGAIVMKFTDISIIDPIMSIAVALFILFMAIKNLFATLELFLEKTPNGINVDEIKEHVLEINGVLDVHHIHIWTLDGTNNYCTLHLVTNAEPHQIKEKVKEELKEHKIAHTTIEIESENESCTEKECHIDETNISSHCHHHH